MTDTAEIEHEDKCGPASSAIISRLIPDSVAGVDLSPCCAAHDADYERGGGWWARLKSDWRLAGCVRCRMAAAGRAVAGLATSAAYLAGVRVGGWACWRWRVWPFGLLLSATSCAYAPAGGMTVHDSIVIVIAGHDIGKTGDNAADAKADAKATLPILPP